MIIFVCAVCGGPSGRCACALVLGILALGSLPRPPPVRPQTDAETTASLEERLDRLTLEVARLRRAAEDR